MERFSAVKSYGKTKSIFWVLCSLLFVFTSCRSYKSFEHKATEKLSPATMQADMRLLKELLENNHPAYTWYTSKDSLDLYYAQAYDRLYDSLTIKQFKNNIAWYVSKIKCGHTSVRSPSYYQKFSENTRHPYLPLFLKAWGDSLVVIYAVKNIDSIFPRGSIIHSINGWSSAALLDSMRQFISGDGFSNNLKDQLISFGFPFAYRNAFDTSKSYLIEFSNTLGERKEKLVLNYRPDSSAKQKTSAAKKQPYPQKRQKHLQSVRYFTIDTSAATAYLKLTAFEASRMRSFYKQFFKTVRELEVHKYNN